MRPDVWLKTVTRPRSATHDPRPLITEWCDKVGIRYRELRRYLTLTTVPPIEVMSRFRELSNEAVQWSDWEELAHDTGRLRRGQYRIVPIKREPVKRVRRPWRLRARSKKQETQ